MLASDDVMRTASRRVRRDASIFMIDMDGTGCSRRLSEKGLRYRVGDAAERVVCRRADSG